VSNSRKENLNIISPKNLRNSKPEIIENLGANTSHWGFL